jgi:hypothetical protein
MERSASECRSRGTWDQSQKPKARGAECEGDGNPGGEGQVLEAQSPDGRPRIAVPWMDAPPAGCPCPFPVRRPPVRRPKKAPLHSLV